MPATTRMKGSGYYDQHSETQLSAIQAFQDWVDDAVANLPLPAPTRPVTVLDLGSSEGRNARGCCCPWSCRKAPFERWCYLHLSGQ